MSKRCALLIDGNWLLMSRQCMARKHFLVENTQEQKQAGRAMTTDLMARSICLALNRLDTIVDDVIIVRDGKSWRKDVTKPASLHDEYKGTRKQDENYDWKEIFGSLTDLEDGMRSCGATVSQLRDAEGDDLIWWWSRKLNSEGENAIVWSSDNDLKQLVQFNGKAWTAWWNEKNGLFVDKELVNENVDDAVGFFLQDAYKTACIEEVNRLSHAVKFSPFAFDSASIIMEKIVCGDASDNIKSVVRTASKPIRKVSPKMWEALREEMGISALDDFFKRKEEIVMAFMKAFTETEALRWHQDDF